MAKKKEAGKKYHTDKPDPSAETVTKATWAAEEMKEDGKTDTNAKELEEFLTEAYGEAITVGGRTVGSVRKTVFSIQSENTSKATKSSRTSNATTIKDLRNAKKLATELNMKPDELADLLGKISKAGFDLDTLSDCLSALDEFAS